MEMDTEALRRSIEAELERNKRDGSSGKEQKILGGLFSVSAPVASLINGLLNYWQPTIRRGAEKFIRDLGQGKGARVQGAVGFAAEAVGWGLTFYDEIIGVAGNANKYFIELRDTKQTLSKVSQANGGTADSFDGLKGNEIVTVEKKRAATNFRHSLSYDAAKLIASAPQAWVKMEDKKHQVVKLDRPPELKKGDTPESYADKLCEYYDTMSKQMEFQAEVATKVTEGVRQRLDEKQIADHLKRKIISNIETSFGFGKQGVALEQKKLDENIYNTAIIVGSVGSEIAKDAVAKNKSDTLKTTALDKIVKLTEAVINDKDATSVEGKKFDAYILDIFQTHQKNMGEPEVGKRFMPKLEEAAKEIAKAITEGRMHPMALVNLVGERHIVMDKGKKIAHHGDVLAQIDAQVKKMPAKFSVDPDDYLKEAAVSEGDIKATMEKLEGEDRAFYISRLPEEVAKKVGVSEEEYQQAAEQIKPAETQRVKRALLDLGAQTDEKLKKDVKLTEEEIKQVRKLAPLAEKDEMKEVMAGLGIGGQIKGDFKTTLDFTLANAMPYLYLDGRHPGDLYEQAGSKLYDAAEGNKEKDKKKHHESGEEERSEKHTSHRRHAANDDDFDRAANDDDFDHAEAEDDLPERPRTHVHHAEHHGMERHHARRMDI